MSDVAVTCPDRDEPEQPDVAALQADLWCVADLVAAAARAQWSRAAQRLLLATVADAAGADRAELWLSGVAVAWRRDGDVDRGDGEVVEFSGGLPSGASVLLLLGCADAHGGEAEEFVEIVGQLVLHALQHTGGVGDAEMRAVLVRCVLDGATARHQAAGLMAERLQCSVAEGARRIGATAQRFGISATGLAQHLVGVGQSGR